MYPPEPDVENREVIDCSSSEESDDEESPDGQTAATSVTRAFGSQSGASRPATSNSEPLSMYIFVSQ